MDNMNATTETSTYSRTYDYGNTKASNSTAASGRSAGSDKVEVKGAGTYGNPQLSEKALEYYNSLKKKYGNLNFVLVAADKKQEAEMMKGSFANSSALTVLIDTDKIEKMAEDENYRNKYEGILRNAASGMNQLKTQLGSTANNVKAYGMSVKDNGTASYFAVIDKSYEKQRERISKKAEQKAADKKAAAKKAEKEKAQERIDEKRNSDEDTVTITANSMEELIKKIQDYYQDDRMNYVRTKEEQNVGHGFDYSI